MEPSKSAAPSTPDQAITTGPPSDKTLQDSPRPAVPRTDKPHAIQLPEFLAVNEDVRLWLEHTGFFDPARRTKLLTYAKELKGLEDEKARIMQKMQSSTPAEASTSSTTVGAVAGDAGKTHPLPLPLAPVDGITSPPYSPTYRGERSGRLTGTPLREMQHRSLNGSRRDFAFFLVKSSNTSNVYMSRRDGLWITQAKNGHALTAAFRECKTVVLFFSINKSKAFQGYAKMSSLPDPSIPHPQWVSTTTHEMHTTHPFRVTWLNDSETHFPQFGELRNPFNEYSQVFVGRDGQEYSEECGRHMMAIMDRGSRDRGLSLSPQLNKTAASRRGEARRRPAPVATTAMTRRMDGLAGLGASRWKKTAAPDAVYVGLRTPTDDLLL